MDTGFRLAKKLGKETSDPKVAYEFLKTVDAKTLIKNSLWAINTESVNSSIFYYNIDYNIDYAISSGWIYVCSRILTSIRTRQEHNSRISW